MASLRPYQRECLERVRGSYRAGRRRVLVSLPTGTGKTVVFAQFPRFFRMKKRLLVLAHRDELLEQAKRKLEEASPGSVVEIEQGARRASPDAQVVVASVPTLGRAGSARLTALPPDEFYLVVVDEAHHAVAKTYRRVFDHFGLLDEGTPKMLVGFTATPKRGDRQRLGDIFEDIVYSREIREMISDGYLCRVRGWRVITNIDLDDVRTRGGDFVESQLATAVDVAERNEVVVRAYQDFGTGRRALVFCADVAHAKSLARAFADAGFSAEPVWGAMPRQERRRVLARFREGEVSVVTNCNVLTEGFDEPRVDCVIMARPTKSRLLYAQMIGRGTRLHDEKEDLVVIDVVDNSRKHTLAGLHAVFELPRGLDLRGADALTTSNRAREIGRRYPWVDLDRVSSAGALEVAAERIELFSFDPPERVRDLTRLAWQATSAGDYCLSLPGDERLVVRTNLLGGADLVLTGAQRERLLRRSASVEEAVALGDRFVTRRRPDVRKVVDLDAPWRRREPTDKQLRLLRRKQVPIPRGLTRGQAAWMIGCLEVRVAS